MFGPLTFEEAGQSSSDDLETPCLLCEESFNIKLCLPIFLHHLFQVHHLVIENPQTIDNLKEYIMYWKKAFRDTPMEQIVPAVSLADSKYFLLSTLSKNDKEVRHKLRLEAMLKVQEFERIDLEFEKSCLFCKYEFKGKRVDYLAHLANDHNIRLGKPQNLVYVDEMLSKIEEKLESLQCLYCENTFTDRGTLKEHMRKKQHKRINPCNQTYDKFYAVNYLDPDRKWHSIDDDTDSPGVEGNCDDNNSDEEYDGWTEAESSIVCLFCAVKETNINKLCLHMNSKHKFNFYTVTSHLDFYQKVKLVNYIRRQMHRLSCVYCDDTFADSTILDSHMETENHYILPDTKAFDQPEFYFPTYENDYFLYFLDEIED